MDRPARIVLDRVALVDRLAEEVEEPTQRLLPDRDGDRPAGVDDHIAAPEALGGVHRHGLHPVVAQVLLDLEHEVDGVAPVALRHLDLEGVVDLREVLVGKGDVHDDARHLLDRTDPTVSVVISHSSPYRYPSASAPATTSKISCVISA